MAPRDLTAIASCVGITLITAVFHVVAAPALLTFISSSVALALVAMLISRSVDELGHRLSPSATGILQSALGNLPELFVSIFGLRAGLLDLVESSLIGSILANGLLVLGIAFFLGGLKNGVQKFQAEQPRAITTLTLLSVSALIVPTLASDLHSAAGSHGQALSVAIAVLLLIVFAGSVTFALRSHEDLLLEAPEEEWALPLTIVVLALASLIAAFVADWFIASVTAATAVLHISHSFTGFVIVAIAGNAVEHVVGIRLAIRGAADYAVSVILNSSLQVALGLIPFLVVLSLVVSSTHFTLVMPPLLVAALALAALLDLVIIFDGEYTWLEGLMLVGLYGVFCALFWWD